MWASSLGKSLDFAELDADLLMIATMKSVSGDVFMLRDIFREHIKISKSVVGNEGALCFGNISQLPVKILSGEVFDGTLDAYDVEIISL